MATQSFFHPGEVQIQNESGSVPQEYEAWAAASMLPELDSGEQVFVEGRTFSFAGTIDSEGRPWASPLLSTGQRLFEVDGPTDISIHTASADGDPLLENIAGQGRLGVLFFDPEHRRRAKSIGTAEIRTDGAIAYHLTRNFGLCPKYIFKRSHDPSTASHRSTATPKSSKSLDAIDQTQLADTNTMFLASFYPDHGPDVTHRGGNPGFLKVLDAHTIEIPEYVGNGMFNTLGNLVVEPRLALTGIDFVSGRTVQLTGTALVHGDPDPHMHRGATRVITLTIEEARVSWSTVGSWSEIESSRHNPAQ